MLDLTLARPLDEIVSTLTPYEFVISDRLHGGLIAALMMRKKVIFLPVGYHKIRSFFGVAAVEFGAAFIDGAEDLQNRLAGLRSTNTDFTSLFCDHADSAFEEFLLATW